MAKFDATDRKFLTLLFAGVLLAVALTGCGGKSPPEEPEANSTPPPLAGVESAAPAGPPYSQPLTISVADHIATHASGDATGWVILLRWKEPVCQFHRLGGGPVVHTMPVKGMQGSPTTCSPAGDTAAFVGNGEKESDVVVWDTATGATRRFIPAVPEPASVLGLVKVPSGPRRFTELRALGGDRFFTYHWSGAFDIWTVDGTRICGQQTRP